MPVSWLADCADKALTALQALPYNTDILEAFADYIIGAEPTKRWITVTI